MTSENDCGTRRQVIDKKNVGPGTGSNRRRLPVQGSLHMDLSELESADIIE